MDTAIKEFLFGSEKRFVSDLERLVNINSVRQPPLPGMPFGKGCRDALAEAEAIASEHGFPMTVMENYAGEITFGPAPDLMLLAHLDVVPEGDGWTKEPYRMSVEEGRAYGRGTTDDKGAALACLYAAEAVKTLYGEPKTGVRLVFGCGEETGSEDMEYYFSKREKLKYTLSPDAEYPLINLEKGRYAPQYVLDAPCDEILLIEGGGTANIVPGKARAVFRGVPMIEARSLAAAVSEKTGAELSVKEEENGCIAVSVCGTSAHAAEPEKGVNANTALLLFLTNIPTCGELGMALEHLCAFVPHGDTRGKAAGVAMEDEKAGKLTFNFGILRYENGKLTVGFDLRCPMCADENNVKRVVDGAMAEAGFRPAGAYPMRKAHYVPEDSPLVKELLKVYEEHTGQKGECLSTGGGTYVHDIEGGVAFGIEFPGTDYRIHGADEYCDIGEMLLTAQMYAAVIRDLCY